MTVLNGHPCAPVREGSRVLELHPDSVYTPEGNRACTPESVSDLLPSIADLGQQVPGLVVLDKTCGKWKCLGGNRRLLCCRILGHNFKAVAVEGDVTEADEVKLRLTENCIREAMSPLEVADDIATYMRLTGCSQTEVAARLHLAPSTVSKALSIKRLPEDLLPLVADYEVAPSVAYLIASLPTPEQQREVMQRAVQQKLKRDNVFRIVQAMKGRKEKKGNKPLKLVYGGVSATVTGNSVEALRAFIAKASEALKKLERDNLPPDLLTALMK